MLGRAVQMLENPKAARAEARLRQHARERLRCTVVAAEHDQPNPGSDVPADLGERPTVGAEADYLGERPAQPGADQAECRWRRHDPQLAEVEALREELAH